MGGSENQFPLSAQGRQQLFGDLQVRCLEALEELLKNRLQNSIPGRCQGRTAAD
jgi:hypothetical protein